MYQKLGPTHSSHAITDPIVIEISLLPCTHQGEMLPSMDATNKTSMSRVRCDRLLVNDGRGTWYQTWDTARILCWGVSFFYHQRQRRRLGHVP